MNILYEGLKEEGTMVIVPSSAVDTMGIGGLMGIANGAMGNGGAKPARIPAAALPPAAPQDPEELAEQDLFPEGGPEA